VSFSELENDTLNQAELNEIKINENNEIFEVPGLNENPRRRTLFLALRVYVKMSEIHETGGV
jgi:hypothetical protein